jgi:exodeoxyribonuclease-3
MKVYSWNINSIRARLERFVEWLQSRQPDVVCLQELKCTDQQFPAREVEAAGYCATIYGEKTYTGVAILAREPIQDVARGFHDGDDEDPQARVIAGSVRGVRVIGVYVPNGKYVGAPAYEYKLQWYVRLRRYLDIHHSAAEPLVLCGDFNVAPEPRELIDTFRQHHQEAGRFSWWDYRNLAFPRNEGLRIDHVFATRPLAERCTDADIDREARKGKLPSDHAPVWAEFDV